MKKSGLSALLVLSMFVAARADTSDLLQILVQDAQHGALNGYIDRSGKVVTPPTYEDAGEFSDGMAPVAQNRRIGFINTSGKLVIPYTFTGQ